MTLEYARESTERPQNNNYCQYQSSGGDSHYGQSQGHSYRGREREDRDGGGGKGPTSSAGLDWICSSVIFFGYFIKSCFHPCLAALKPFFFDFCLFTTSARVTTFPVVESAIAAVPSAHPTVLQCREAVDLLLRTVAIGVLCVLTIWYVLLPSCCIIFSHLHLLYLLYPLFISLGKRDTWCVSARARVEPFIG